MSCNDKHLFIFKCSVLCRVVLLISSPKVDNFINLYSCTIYVSSNYCQEKEIYELIYDRTCRSTSRTNYSQNTGT